MHPTCCGCHREISNENAKNILNDDLVIGSSDYVDIAGPIVSMKIIKLRDVVELLTGYKVSKNENCAVLCMTCCQKIESFIIFRMQLLASFEKLSKYNDSGNMSKPISDPESLQCFKHQKNSTTMDQCANVITNEIPDNYKLLEPKVTVDDDVIVDDKDVPLELITSLNDESETNDSFGSNKLPNDQENNNLNDSDNSNEMQDVNDSKEIFSKVQDNDIESEVDVYSGEDEEVLELDIQCKKDDIIDAESETESETEICDYGPIGKKMKNYNALSSVVLF
ncbi:hypothetical protein KPH14_009168 [Odynerus spinipes]|uniref:ZAD domain-containing protein n=1 Tax=Odynerus spinipes TaxID=1348599 RepID=A0AAD9VQM8_9HYME|nr:hypothetical protein KPH14_009168 [Odynerus spinipes]